MNRSLPLFSKIAAFLKPRLIKIELIYSSGVLAGFGILSLNPEIGSTFIILSMISLATTYFFYGQQAIENQYDKFLVVLLSYTYVIIVIGILFTIQLWPGAYLTIKLSYPVVLFSTLSLLILDLLLKKVTVVRLQDYIRIFVFILLLLVLHLSPVFEKAKELEKSSLEQEDVLSE